MKKFVPIFFVTISCIETFQIEIRESSTAVVIEASLTDELKQHSVNISYSNSIDEKIENTPLDSALFNGIGGAVVWIESTTGRRIMFTEQFSGRYASEIIFQPEVGNSYTLNIDLPNGNSYRSDTETLPPESSLDSIYSEFVILPSAEDETENRGVQIFADGHDLTGSTSWYRYEWEDAYQFRSPFVSLWSAPDVLWEEPVHICYRKDKLFNMILATSQGLTESRVSEIPIRFLDENEMLPVLEYTIKVRQYSVPLNAYRYYKDLKENNEGSGTFFDKQKGTVLGNIHSISNNDEVVLGYFEVARVKETQIFYSADDFPENFAPKYPCPRPTQTQTFTVGSEGINWLISGRNKFFLIGFQSESEWLVGPKICGDCTGIGSLNRPDLLKAPLEE